MDFVLTVFQVFKNTVEGISHMQRDALHVHFGLFLFLGFATVFRGKGRFRHALMLTTAFCLLGEFFDAANRLSGGRSPHWLGSLKDVVNTLMWPYLAYFAGPWLARLLGLKVSPVEAPVEASGDAPSDTVPAARALFNSRG
ncbi:MAG: hypothetical protein Q4B17_03345 [Lautropia sp.]|nr:hypothetical protein [Lautropia sp.]